MKVYLVLRTPKCLLASRMDKDCVFTASACVYGCKCVCVHARMYVDASVCVRACLLVTYELTVLLRTHHTQPRTRHFY